MFPAVLLALWLSLALAACDGSRPASPAGARSDRAGEPVLNVYNWTDFIDRTVIESFEQEYGIRVNYDVYESNDELETKLLVGHANYDVVVPGGAFLERDIKAQVYQKLDRTQLPNFGNLEPQALRDMTIYDPGNQYALPYMWLTTTGIAYDPDKIQARMPAAPTDSWRMFYDPEVLAHFRDCGVSVLEAPDDVVSTAMAYLGRDPNSESPDDLQAAERLLLAMRPYVRYIDSAQYLERLANGEVCLAMGWAGDVTTARERARQAGQSHLLSYSIPKEGTIKIFDVLAIPVDAPHVHNAHLFLDFLLRPEIAARNSNAVNFATPVTAALPLLRESLRNDSGTYPPPEVWPRLVPQRAHSLAFTRLLNRTWTRFKTGQ
jgi:putrescine transport system substrate-binding protein